MLDSCSREQELLDRLGLGQQPQDELALHVASCPSCGELLLVAGAIFEDATTAMRHAPIPSSGGVWWRIERRAREEANRTATRTVSAVQIGTVFVAAAIAVILLGGLPTLAGWIATLDLSLPTNEASKFWSLPLLLGLATLLTLAPVAIYFAVTEE
ncbi:MAG: hypothetical protein ABI779_11295 [Acidobacteriota bacterium]